VEGLEESDNLPDADVLAGKMVDELCGISVGIISPQLSFSTSIA